MNILVPEYMKTNEKYFYFYVKFASFCTLFLRFQMYLLFRVNRKQQKHRNYDPLHL